MPFGDDATVPGADDVDFADQRGALAPDQPGARSSLEESADVCL
jgi:hypothetical protein